MQTTTFGLWMSKKAPPYSTRTMSSVSGRGDTMEDGTRKGTHMCVCVCVCDTGSLCGAAEMDTTLQIIHSLEKNT